MAAAPGRVVPGRADASPVPLSSSVAQYLASLATQSATTSGERRSSAAGESSTPHHENIWLNILSWRNIATGVEAAVVTRPKALILWYSLFVNPLPGPVTLTSEVHRAWLEPLNYISAAENIEASEGNLQIVSRRRYQGTSGVVLSLKDPNRHSGVRSQSLSNVGDKILKLYHLPEHPTAITQTVDFLLEKDTLIFPANGYEVGVR